MIKTPIVLRLQHSQAKDMMNLSITLAFTGSSGALTHSGVRIVSQDIAFDGKENVFGFKNGDDIVHPKLPTQDLTVENQVYRYVRTDVDRQENGAFRLLRVPSDQSGSTYLLKGVFYAQGHRFEINETLRLNEEKVCDAA